MIDESLLLKLGLQGRLLLAVLAVSLAALLLALARVVDSIRSSYLAYFTKEECAFPFEIKNYS
jgi:hypothetical protein